MSQPAEPGPSGEPYGIGLIGGSGRSGTTLLRQIFSLHPRVATLSVEARFLSDPDGIADFLASMDAYWSPWTFDIKVRRLEALLNSLGTGPSRVLGSRGIRRSGRRSPGHGPVTYSGRTVPRAIGSALTRVLPRYWAVNLRAECPGYDALVEELLHGLVEFEFEGRWMGMPPTRRSRVVYGLPAVTQALRSFCRGFVGSVCRQQEASHFVEDTPYNLLAFGVLQPLLPESRLVHIYRDPRDVVASYVTKRWSPSDPLRAAAIYAGVMRQWELIRASLREGSYMELGLTELVQQPEAVLGRLCAFWGLPWDEALLRSDLSRAHRGRWKSELAQELLPELELSLAPYLERYGD